MNSIAPDLTQHCSQLQKLLAQDWSENPALIWSLTPKQSPVEDGLVIIARLAPFN